jgi:hypothetical protein
MGRGATVYWSFPSREPTLFSEEGCMLELASSKGGAVAVSAGALAVILTIFVPAGHPWPTLASAALAFAAAVWVVKTPIRPARVSDVIAGVEAESVARPAAPRDGVVSTKTSSC